MAQIKPPCGGAEFPVKERCTMSKKRVPHFVRWRYAMDATPEIKGVEASPAALTDAKAVIDAQEAGVAPRNIGVDLD